MSTSQILNLVLRDRQMRDWEKRLKIIEELRNNKTKKIDLENPDYKTAGL